MKRLPTANPVHVAGKPTERLRLNFDDVAFVTPPDTVEARRTKVEPRDLLFTITGIVGLVAVVPDDIGEAYVSQHVAIVRLNDEIDPTFVAAFLADVNGGQAQISRLQYGQTKPGFGLDNIRSLQAFCPPLPLQRESAAWSTHARELEDQQTRSRHYFNELANSLLAQAFTGELTAQWHEAHREALAREAEEMQKRLEKKKRPTELPGAEASLEELFQSLSRLPAAAEIVAKAMPQIDWDKLVQPVRLPEFTRFADALRPFTELMAESLNTGLIRQVAALNASIIETWAKAIGPLVDSWKQATPFYAELASKISQLAQLQLRRPMTRAELQDAVMDVVSELPRFWTLVDLVEDWRLNHLPRNTIREAVDMLVVLAKVRSASISYETNDPENPIGYIQAFTCVSDTELVEPKDIHL